MASKPEPVGPELISWKSFWTIFSALITAGIGVLGMLAHQAVVAVAAAVGVAVLFSIGARIVVHRAHMFAEVAEPTRQQMVRWMSAGTGAHVVWVLGLQVRPDQWFLWVLGLAALAISEYALAAGHEYLWMKLHKPMSTGLAPVAPSELDKTTQGVQAALRRAGQDHMTVQGWEEIGKPTPYGIAVMLQEPSRAMSGKKVERFGSAAAKPIAIALGEILKKPIMTNWVQVHEQRFAGLYRLLIVTEDVMARVHPYRDDVTWTSIETPMFAGLDIESNRRFLRVDQNGQVIGATREGKSSFVNQIIAHGTRCPDARVWACGVEKLYDLVAPWIEPYEGWDGPIPIDWIASGPQDSMELLAAGMRIARYRQRVPLAERRKWQKIVIILEEASFLLTNRKAKVFYQGAWLSATEIVAALSRGASSGGVYLCIVDQRSTIDNKGDQGGNTNANLNYAVGFRSNDAAEIGRLIGDYQAPNPDHKGSAWLKAGDGELPAMIKNEYMQEMDPMREKLHDGLTVSDVAWSRRFFAQQREPLDPGATQAAGDAYASRFTRMCPELQAYLTQADVPDDSDTLSHTQQEGFDEVSDQLAKVGVPLTPPPVSQPSSNGVAVFETALTRAKRIEAIVREAGEPLPRAQIIAALHDLGDPAAEQSVQNALGRLTKEGQLARTEQGYVAQ